MAHATTEARAPAPTPDKHASHAADHAHAAAPVPALDEQSPLARGEPDTPGTVYGTAPAITAPATTSPATPVKPPPPLPPVAYWRLFSFAKPLDLLLGCVGATVHGAAYPVFFLLVGDIVDAMGAGEVEAVSKPALLLVIMGVVVWGACWAGDAQDAPLADALESQDAEGMLQ